MLKAGNSESIERLLLNSPGLRHGIYTYKGCVTNEYLSKRFEVKYTALDLLITSGM
jgi:alanine dehydrogenase